MAPLRLTFLGGTDVRRADGAMVALSARALGLLGHLVVHSGVPQPRSHLAGLLWPDSAGAQARTNLRRELHLLRTTLGDECGVRSEGTRLVWEETERCVADLVTFRTARTAALAAVTAGDADAVSAAGAVALTAYQGPFLPGFHDDWALDAREQLHDECVELCARLADFWAARGDPVSGMPFARRRVQLTPLEETGYRQLMDLQVRVGDLAGAMTTFHRCASALEQELGVEPGPDLRRVFEEILADSRAGRSAATDPLSVDLVRPEASALVGRRREVAALLASWESAAHATRFVLVTGGPGVGKSRLVRELASEVRRRDGVVAAARCFAATGGLPLAPVAEWLRTPHLRRSVRRLDPTWRVEAERLVPPRGGPEPPSTPDSTTRAKVDAWQRHRFYEGLARAVAEVGRPLLLTLDDLQWCDRATLSWLSFLLALRLDAPVLVVATAREEELGRSVLAEPLRAMSAAGRVEVLPLGDLDGGATGELAARVLGREVADEELALLRSVAGGNPLYVIEALRASMATPGPLAASDLEGVLQERLSHLPEAARDVAGLAAAIGRDFTLDLLTEASDLPADEVVRLVDLLWRHRILRQDDHRYHFSHDLLRSAAYTGISPARRWLVHRRLAQALELVHGSDGGSAAAEIADQYDRGGQGERALPFFTRAARQASAVFAHDEAVRMWDRALATLATLPEHRGRDEQELAILVEKLAPLSAFRGYTAPGMEDAAQRVASLAERLGRPDDRALGLITLWTTVFVQGRVTESLDLGRTALASTRTAPALAAQAHFAIAGSLLSLGEVGRASAHFRASCELAGETDSLPYGTRTEVHARGWWTHAHWLAGETEAARVGASDAVALAREIEHPYSLAVGLAYAAVTAYLRGDADHLGHVVEELTVLCERYRFAYYSEWARILGGWLEGGRAGADAATAGIRALVAEDALTRQPFWLSLLADVHRRGGDDERARGVLDTARAYAGRHGDVWWLPEVLRARAALSGDAAAEAYLREAVDLAREQGSTALLERCERDLAALGERNQSAAT